MVDAVIIVKTVLCVGNHVQSKYSKGNKFLPQTINFNPYIYATRCRRSLVFQTINSVISKSLSLKYKRFTPSGCK